MKYYTNDCVDCGLPCLGAGCPYRKVEHFRCDFCKEEDVVLYHYDGWEICKECLLEKFDIVEGTEEW